MPFDQSSYLRLAAPQCMGTGPSGATFATSTGDLFEASAFGPGTFRLRIGPQTRPDYGLIVGKTKSCTVTEENGAYVLQSGAATLELRGTPLVFRLRNSGNIVLTSITDLHVRGMTRLPAFGRVRQGGQWTAAVALASGEPVYGLGEKFGSLNKRGQLLHSWVQDAMGVNTGLAHHEVPFAWSPGAGKGAWGLFVHTPGAVIHGIGHPDWSHRSYAVVVDDEALDVFLFVADTPAGILAQYGELTGRTPVVPSWSLGLCWAPSAEGSPEGVVQAVSALRARNVPCDVVMLDGSALWDPERRFDFQWDRARIGDPAAMMSGMAAEHARVGIPESPYVSVQSPLFTELAARGFLLRNAYGTPYVLSGTFMPPVGITGSAPARAPDCGLIDFTNPTAYGWWRDAHAELFGAGIVTLCTDGREHVPEDAVAFNGDRGVRLHNVYPLLYNRCVLEAAEKFRGPADEAPIVFARGGWAASQRVPVHLGPEAQHDWEALAATLRGALSLGMSGVPLAAITCPGSYGAAEAGPELALRWLQAAIFASQVVVRGAAQGEPWAANAHAEAVAKKWLAFRYRLIPYLARAVDEATRSGLPVMRAMPLAFPGNALVRGYETQFLCGDALLVAPILQPGGEVEIALPPGGWFDLNSRQRITGQRVVRYRATLDQFPVFGREGYALPLGRPMQHTGEIDGQRPLAQLWLFGKPAHALTGFAQANIRMVGEAMRVEAAADVKIERFGDASECEVATLP